MRRLLAVLLLACLGLACAPDHDASAWFPRGGGSSGQTLTLLTLEPGFAVSGGNQVGAYGIYTGTEPTSITSATWTNCGGGAAGSPTLVTKTGGVYPAASANSILIMANPPLTAGAACVLTVTLNTGATATTPGAAMVASNTSPVLSQIHNSQPWQPSHSYTLSATPPYTRVNNGPGWNGTNYVPGSALNNYQLTSTGSCTSASSGGPSGTGSSISDGTCVWKYTSGVDYVTFLGWANDAPAWSSGTTYTYNQKVTTNVANHLRSYVLDMTGSGQLTQFTSFCTSTVQPTGTSPSIGADGCKWDYAGELEYSSQATSGIPDWTAANNTGLVFPHITYAPTAVLWNDAEYVVGTNNETGFSLSGHLWGPGPEAGLVLGTFCITPCQGLNVTVASGEGMPANYLTSTPLVGYDPTKGVALRNSTNVPSGLGSTAAGIFVLDAYSVINGIQAQSTYGTAILGFNDETYTNVLADGGGSPSSGVGGEWGGAAVGGDVGTVLANSLVITHGPIGVAFKYNAATVAYTTIVNANGTTYPSTVAIVSGNDQYGSTLLQNNIFSGFVHGYGSSVLTFGGSFAFAAGTADNFTDTTGPDNTGTTWWVAESASGTSGVQAIPGTTYSETTSALFATPTTNLRPGSATTGSCAALGNSYDSPDMLGQTRPTTLGAATNCGPAYTP